MPAFLRWLLRLLVTNPIAVRLVHNGGRRVKHMYIRSAYLAVLIVVLLWSLLLNTGAGSLSYQRLAEAGAKSFVYIAYLQITLICVLAPVFMGGAIAQEANPRTWEVLLTTPLTAGQIVFGNLLGRLFFVLALLFCSLPLFAITQYFGGVPGSAIFASYLVAAGAAILVGALAIALSVSRLAGKRAFFVFYVCVVSYLAATIAVDIALRNAGRGQGVNGDGVTVMTAVNPFLALRALLNPTTYPRAAEGLHTGVMRWMLETPVTTWCVGSVLLSALFLAASTVTVRTGGIQMLGASDDGVPLTRRIMGQRPGPAGEHRAPRPVWHNPIAWREAASRNSSRGKIIARWTFVALGLAFGAGAVFLYHNGTLDHDDFRFAILATVIGELLVISLVAINTSATAISKEREDGHLDLILTTPITASAYLWGKLRGLVFYLMPLLIVPLGTLAIAGLYVLAGGLGRDGGVEVTTSVTAGAPMTAIPVVLPEAAIAAAIVVVPFLAFCVMVGLQWSLKSKGVLSSTVGTVGVVAVVAGIAGLCAWQAAPNIPLVGPLMGAVSPASTVYGVIEPETALIDTVKEHGLATARSLLLVGALIGAALHAAICYGIHTSMVRNFDMTVRKLAGTN
ncbi:MAG TPA: ABC transporter permease subunit [Phycisphaerales bacterium]|nr:ABC transporter permease subunit [Phycisphaerales bacterium]